MTNETSSWIHALLGWYEAYHGLMLMVLLTGIRMTVAFMVLPPTSDTVLPGTLRNGMVYVLAFFVAAGQSPQAFETHNNAMLIVLACKEAFLGLAFGFAAAPVFWIAQSVGTLIDDLTGFNSVQMTNPLRGDQSTPVATLLLQLVATLFYVGGGMSFMLGALFQSYKWWPPQVMLPTLASSAEAFLIGRTDTVWTAMAKLGTPVMLVLVLVDVALGIIARSADKLEPNSLSQPLRGMVGMILLVALVSVFASQVVGDVLLGDFAGKLSTGMMGTPAK